MIYYQEEVGNSAFCYTRDAFCVPDPDSHIAEINCFFDKACSGKLPSSKDRCKAVVQIDSNIESLAPHSEKREPCRTTSIRPESSGL